MRNLLFPTVLALSIVLASAAAASEIYKWTDEEGNVHYTDKPISPKSERVDIQSRPTNSTKVRANIQARLAQQEDDNPDNEVSSGPTEEEMIAEAQHRSERCDIARERHGRFEQSRRLFREDDDGERVYLDDAESDAARARVEDQIREYCNS